MAVTNGALLLYAALAAVTYYLYRRWRQGGGDQPHAPVLTQRSILTRGPVPIVYTQDGTPVELMPLAVTTADNKQRIVYMIKDCRTLAVATPQSDEMQQVSQRQQQPSQRAQQQQPDQQQQLEPTTAREQPAPQSPGQPRARATLSRSALSKQQKALARSKRAESRQRKQRSSRHKHKSGGTSCFGRSKDKPVPSSRRSRSRTPSRNAVRSPSQSQQQPTRGRSGTTTARSRAPSRSRSRNASVRAKDAIQANYHKSYCQVDIGNYAQVRA